MPIFGVSWNPPELEAERARRIIAFLEDRRVLYNPSSVEIPEHCVQSVLEIRRMLSAEIGALEPQSELATALRALRSACRKFLDETQAGEDRIVRFGASPGHWASWQFNSALGELRGVFGVYLAKIATSYGLDIEDDLAVILPEKDSEDDHIQ